VSSPSFVAARASSWIDSREEISTVAVLTSNPALLITSAAAFAFSARRSASRTCFPAPTRRAIVWPMAPGPMATMTLLILFETSELGRTRDRHDPGLLREEPSERDLRGRRLLEPGDLFKRSTRATFAERASRVNRGE
jgi:hypothetical protein